MMTTRYTRVHSHGHAQRHISAKFKLEHSSTTHLTHFHKVPSRYTQHTHTHTQKQSRTSENGARRDKEADHA